MFFQRENRLLNILTTVTEMGDGLCVTVAGGDRAHIGCTSIAEPRESLTGSGKCSATVSTYNVTGHKDNEIADRLAYALASGLNRRTVVVCGIHFDHFTEERMEQIRQFEEELLQDLKKELSRSDPEE